MTVKLLGAALVVLGCGGFGFSMAAYHRREEQELHQFLLALEWMEWELSCRLTPLPELFVGAAKTVNGPVRSVLDDIARKLETQLAPDAAVCVQNVLTDHVELCDSLRTCFSELGTSLGRFDLPGQLQGIRSVASRASRTLEERSAGRSQRLRSYQTLGLCAGAALAILFL